MNLACRTSCLAILTLALEILGAPRALPQPATAEPAIRIETSISERTPEALARRLSDLIGAEVRLPQRTKNLPSLKPGEWTATSLLNETGKGLGASWEIRHELTSSPVPRRASKLPRGRKVTLRAADLGFERAVRLLEREGACTIELPESLPSGRFRVDVREAPVESALLELARSAGLKVRTAVVFETPEEAQARQVLTQERRLTQEAQHQSAIAGRLQELYGADPSSDEFPWETIDREAVAYTLSRELDLDLSTVEVLMERARLERPTQPCDP